MSVLKLVLNGEFIEKQTEKSFDEIQPLIEALSQQGKISRLTFSNGTKRTKGGGSINNRAYCLDVNNFASSRILDSIKFTTQGINNAMPYQFNGMADPSTESMFDNYDKFTVKFPVITFNTVRKLFTKIFTEAKITEDVFETLFYSDEEVDTDKIVELCIEAGWLDVNESEFLLNQLDFALQLFYDLIRNTSQSVLAIGHNGKIPKYENEKEFLAGFVVEQTDEDYGSFNIDSDDDAFYDRYDFSSPRLQK